MSKVNESVLVVEDDAALREALVDTLHAAGLPALAAADAPSALQLLRNQEMPPFSASSSRVRIVNFTWSR